MSYHTVVSGLTVDLFQISHINIHACTRSVEHCVAVMLCHCSQHMQCLQHNPSFGAYLHRYDCKPATNMMSLIALLKCPIQQVQKLV